MVQGVSEVRSRGRYGHDGYAEGARVAERAELDAQARARAEAWASGEASVPSGDAAPPLGPLTCGPGNRHDFDHCGMDPIAGAKLYALDVGDADEISPRDVQQGTMGDCYFAATMAALSETAEGRALLRSRIQENRDAVGNVTSYTVTFKERDTGPLNRWGILETYHDVKVDVQPTFPAGSASATERARVPKPTPEIWPLVLEKAFALYRGGYNAIAHGGTPLAVIPLLTGRAALAYPPGVEYDGNALANDLHRGRILTASSSDQLGPNAEGVARNHVYHIAEAYVKDGKVWVRLENPWGYDHPKEMTYSRFAQLFVEVEVGRVK